MTAIEQPPLTFPSAPIDANTQATVELVGNDWRSDEDWQRFVANCREAAALSALMGEPGVVDPNIVRDLLTNEHGLTIEPRRLSAFYRRAAGKDGFLDFSHWGISEDHKGRNAGRPCRIYKLRDNA